MNDPARKGRRTLVLLAVVFLGPMAVAMLLYATGFRLRPDSGTQHGVLYEPARPLPEISIAPVGKPEATTGLQGKWTLIYIGAGACDSPCRTALVEMRQVRRALGRDMSRIQRLYLVTSGSADVAYLAKEHPGIAVLGPGPAADEIVGIAGVAESSDATKGVAASTVGEIFLTDPLGNLVMRYPAGTGMKGIHGDLKHLLKISTIG